MNKNKKLEELERRQREIADEMEALRQQVENAGGHEPRDLDVYIDKRDGDIGVYVELIWGLNFVNRAGWTTREQLVESGRYVYLGKFNDVFITKQEVAKAIGWELISLSEERALAALGITQELVEED